MIIFVSTCTIMCDACVTDVICAVPVCCPSSACQPWARAGAAGGCPRRERMPSPGHSSLCSGTFLQHTRSKVQARFQVLCSKSLVWRVTISRFINLVSDTELCRLVLFIVCANFMNETGCTISLAGGTVGNVQVTRRFCEDGRVQCCILNCSQMCISKDTMMF